MSFEISLPGKALRMFVARDSTCVLEAESSKLDTVDSEIFGRT